MPDLQLALAAVADAARICRSVQADLVNAQTLEKDDRSPVTVADFAAQAIVCRRLHDAQPDVPVVGEEGAAELRQEGQRPLAEAVARHAGLTVRDALDAIDHGGYDPAADNATAERYWTLDPIDGTKGFLRGDQYAIALGLIEGGKLRLGVLGCPNLRGGWLFSGDLTKPSGVAARWTLPDSGEPTHDSDLRIAPAAAETAVFCESVESGHTRQDASARIAERLGIDSPPYRIDSQCKYAAVALGLAQVYLRLPTRPGYVERIWDHAAGVALVQKAGGVVTDVTGKPLDFAHGRGLEQNRGVICTAGNAKFHQEVVDAVQAELS